MWLGRYHLGEHVPLKLQCKNTSDVPTAPDAAPRYTVLSSTAPILSDLKLPAPDPADLIGFFQHQLRLGSAFATGVYTVTYSYLISSTAYAETDQFEVVAGGHQDGNVIAMIHLNRPQANFIVWELDSGKIQRGTNPSV